METNSEKHRQYPQTFKEMSKPVRLLTIAITTLVLATLAVETSLAKLSNQSKLLLKGIGDIPIGLTVAETARAAGIKLVPLDSSSPKDACYYVKPQGLKDVGFMVIDGKVARVDVWSESKVTTLRGAKIGDSEARIKSLYPGQIKVTPHEYVTGGHYLTFTPKDKADKNYRLVFETDGKRVNQMRSGKLPEVSYIEGCS
jgi:hypothetical protein